MPCLGFVRKEKTPIFDIKVHIKARNYPVCIIK